MSSGSGKNLKSWGRVMQVQQKTWQEQDTWKAARTCLLAMPWQGFRATTQTAEETDPEHINMRLQEPGPQPLGPDSPSEGGERAWLFWHGLAEGAWNAAITLESKGATEKLPPYMFKHGTKPQGGGRDVDVSGGNAEVLPNGAGTCGQEGGVTPGKGLKTNQSTHFKSCPYKTRTSSSRRQGEPRGREWPDPRTKGQGRNPTKGLGSPETSS